MKKLYISILVIISAILPGWSVKVFAQSVTFSYSGALQTYKVPKDVTSISVDMQGAMGGRTQLSRGGYGGRVQCELAVTTGDVLYINIGGAGHNSNGIGVGGGYNGGGAGSEEGGGGGGASDIRIGSTGLSNRVVVAGGGGGGCGPTYTASENYDRGGDGGGLIGENGYSNGMNKSVENNFAGTGGSSTYPEFNNLRNGTTGAGGNGYANYIGGGGGGGGGYFGGGGGDESGGGGGSSYTNPIFTSSVVHTRGYNTKGNGIIIIKPLIPTSNKQPQNQELTAAAESSIIQDSVFKPNGYIYGSVFCDFAYKAHADTILEGRSGISQYAKVPANTSIFQFRRIYMGYNYEINRKFSAEFLLAAEDDYGSKYYVTQGDLLANNKFAPFIKLANLRWKNIFKGSDLVIGQTYTPAFHATSEEAWAYRSVARTLTAVYRTNEYDLGVSLQGHLPSNDNLGYNFLVGNGTAAMPENDGFKWFYGDVYYKFFNKKLIVDFYADYQKLTWTPSWHRDRQMNKIFVAYTVPKITVGVEVFTNRLMADCIATRTDGVTMDTITTKRNAISIFTHGRIYKEKIGFFARYDKYTWGKNNNSGFISFNDQTTYYDHNTDQQFVTLGLDYSPSKNVHIMPNVWYNYYENTSPAGYGYSNTDYDLVCRVTGSYQFGK